MGGKGMIGSAQGIWASIGRSIGPARAWVSGVFSRIRTLLAGWWEDAFGKLTSHDGYGVVAKIVFQGVALTVGLLTAFSLIDAASTAERAAIRDEVNELTHELYSNEPGQREHALRGYRLLIENHGEDEFAISHARQAIISYFERWKSGRLDASQSEKTKEILAALTVVDAIGPEGWYDSAWETGESANLNWLEGARPLDWKEPDDPRAIFFKGPFATANFDEVHLGCISLDQATFESSRLSSANFSGSSFDEANFINSSIQASKFNNTYLGKADFSIATISLTDFSQLENGGCEIVGRTPRKADLNRARFHDTGLTDVSFAGARLESAAFLLALLTNVNFSAVEGANVEFTDSTFDRVQFDNASLRSADFSNARFSRVSFDGADLNGANFSGAIFSDLETFLSLTKASDLNRANFSAVTLPQEASLCLVLDKGAVLVTERESWRMAGRPQDTTSFSDETDRQVYDSCMAE